jgi:hypothetical protein
LRQLTSRFICFSQDVTIPVAAAPGTVNKSRNSEIKALFIRHLSLFICHCPEIAQ